MKELLAEVSAHHFPSPPATPAQVAAFEARVGWKLDEDLRAFYLHCDGAPLIRRFSDANDHLLPREEIRRARVAMRPGDDDRFGPASWYTLVDLQDSDYLILDAAHQVDGKDPRPRRVPRDVPRGGAPYPAARRAVALLGGHRVANLPRRNLLRFPGGPLLTLLFRGLGPGRRRVRGPACRSSA
ncbi:SMI1/KNR4 family protein [Corallococcus sp. RDP092CA]|uniref:SMI1/KNR4 family protein n=1 Tax=Corallococcus sp. RDP092CA TaxID=3109369 RepID=UPI0035B001A7